MSSCWLFFACFIDSSHFADHRIEIYSGIKQFDWLEIFRRLPKGKFMQIEIDSSWIRAKLLNCVEKLRNIELNWFTFDFSELQRPWSSPWTPWLQYQTNASCKQLYKAQHKAGVRGCSSCFYSFVLTANGEILLNSQLEGSFASVAREDFWRRRRVSGDKASSRLFFLRLCSLVFPVTEQTDSIVP